MLERLYQSRKLVDNLPQASWVTFWMAWVPWWECVYYRRGNDGFRLFHDATCPSFSVYPARVPSALGMTSGPGLYGVVQMSGPDGDGRYALELDPFTLLSDQIYGRRLIDWRVDRWGILRQKSYPYLDLNRNRLVVALSDPAYGCPPGLYVFDLEDLSQKGFVSVPFVQGVLSRGEISLCYVDDENLAVVESSWGRTLTRNLRVAIVDWVNLETKLYTSVSPSYGVAVDHLHRLLLALTADRRVEVYSLNPCPATLSPPDWPDGAPRLYEPTRVRVRLTGSDGEPCPGYAVHWYLTNGNGLLYRSVTPTGDDGYAYNHYVGTRQADETIVAEVIY